DHRGTQAKATPEAPGHVVLATPLPDPEFPGVADAVVPRIEAKHDLAQGHLVETTVLRRPHLHHKRAGRVHWFAPGAAWQMATDCAASSVISSKRRAAIRAGGAIQLPPT